MNVLIFGATGMVGQGVLLECLRDNDVQIVRTVGRSVSSVQNPKLRETVLQDMWNYGSIEPDLVGFDACFFCMGVSAVGMTEAEYERVNYGITMAAAETLVRLNPGMTFIYVSGAGTDSSEKGRTMWARVKGKTENALQRLPFHAVYSFRPGLIEPAQGVRSKTTSYRIIYGLMKPVLPALRRLFPNYIVTTQELARAMLRVARHGFPRKILETKDIRAALSA